MAHQYHSPIAAEPDLDPRALRDCFGQFVTGVTVVTSLGPDGLPHGATVNSFTPISLDPPLVLVSLRRESRSCAYLEGAPFAINVLRREQQALGLHFAGVADTGADITWCPQNPGCAPTLAETLATVCCAPYTVVEGGDHLLFLGRVTRFAVHGGEPLVFHCGSFQRLQPERPIPEVREFGASSWYGDCPLFRPPDDERFR